MSSGQCHKYNTTEATSISEMSDQPEAFDALVRDIMERPELLLTADLTAEQVMKLQARLNPYAGIAGPPAASEHKRIAAVSYTNLREDYFPRSVM